MNKRLSEGDHSTSKAPIKVAIIDFDLKSNYQKPINPPLGLRIVGTKSFSENAQGTQQHISKQHLSNRAYIFAETISMAAPVANLLVADVQADEVDNVGWDYKIAEAIRYSVSEWEVDIISMSFSLSEASAKISEAVRHASMHGVLVFAAASDGMTSSRGFLARLREVICIYSSDGLGNKSAFNPFPQRLDFNFSILGEGIPVPGLQQVKPTQLASGMSLATPIAAGMAATLLQYAHQKQADGLLSLDEANHLHRREGMVSVLATMTAPRDMLDFIDPARLWGSQALDEPIRKIKWALAESLGPQQAVEDDVYETASVIGGPDSVHSESTAVGDGSLPLDEAIASSLLEDLVMKPLFEPSVSRTGLPSFRRHFARLLHLLASRLDREAETKLEKQFAALLQKRAAKISKFVTNLISLADTEKSARIAQLTETETVRTEILNRYIADTTTAPLSAQVQTSIIEAEDDIDEDNIDETDTESDDGDESAIDNVETVENFMRSTKAFQRLREDMCLFAFPDTRQLIQTVVDELDVFNDDFDVATINCHIRWEVLACCETEIEDPHNVAQTVTFTGNSKHSQAASCAEYLRQTWPTTGTGMMRAFHEAVTKRVCDVEFSRKHCLRLKLEPNISKLEQPESASVEITGSRPNILETLEQLAWLAATFRKPQGGSMTSSYANLTRIPEPLMPTKGAPLLELTLISPRPVNFTTGLLGNCWIPLLRESILACGFPIATRNAGLGLEISVPLMMYLSGVHYPVAYNNQGLVFRSHIRKDPAEFSMLVPTQKLGESIQWHFVDAKTDQTSLGYDGDNNISVMNEMAKPDSWYQTMKLKDLMNSRAFIGCWPYAKVLIGTEDFRFRTIRESGLPTAGPELELSTAGNVNIGGNISAGIATILRIGGTFGIAFGYEVRSAQRAIIPAGQVGPPLVYRDASRQPLLLYDSEAHCGWIVPELSVALDMTHHFLASLNLAHDIRTRLRYALATGDGGAAASAALDACRNEILWEDDTKKIRFHHVVSIFLSLFGQRKPMAALPKLSSWQPFKQFQSPRGWEYKELRGLDQDVHKQRKANEDHKKHRLWWEITSNPTVLVLFGKGFGQVILPDSDRSSVCPTWKAIPPGEGLLTASMPCLQKLSKDDKYTQLKHTKLRWHQHENSTLFEPCQPGRACVRIQELRNPPTFGRDDINAPAQGVLGPEGAVVFGQFPEGGRNPPCPGPPARITAEAKTPVLPLLIAVAIGMLSAALMSRLQAGMVALASLFGEQKVLSE